MNKWIMILLIAAGILLQGCSSSTKKASLKKSLKPVNYKYCSSAKEYVTTYNYLDSQKKSYGLSQEEIKLTANEVSKGCEGAAGRFIKSFNLMSKVGLGGRSSLKTAVVLANSTDQQAEAFREIFLMAYLEKNLNLDMRTSYQLAKGLSVDYLGNTEISVKDFKSITSFCMKNKFSGLSFVSCAKIASEVIKSSQSFARSIAQDFIDTFLYIRKGDSLKLNISESMAMAVEVVSTSPGAGENFKLAYEFGISKEGLNYSANQAVQFARKIVFTAEESYKERLPASENKSN